MRAKCYGALELHGTRNDADAHNAGNIIRSTTAHSQADCAVLQGKPAAVRRLAVRAAHLRLGTLLYELRPALERQ